MLNTRKRLTLAELAKRFAHCPKHGEYVDIGEQLIENAEIDDWGTQLHSTALIFSNCSVTNCNLMLQGRFVLVDCDITNCKFPNAGGTFAIIRCKVLSTSIDVSFKWFDRLDSFLEINLADKIGPWAIHDSKLENCTIRHSIESIQGTHFSKCRFVGCLLGMSYNNTFANCTFVERTQIAGPISGTSIIDSTFQKDTNFEDVNILSSSITKRTLLTLGKNRAGLTDANMIGVKILDPLDDIKRMFSGINLYVHWFALLGFVGPYVAFVSYKWSLHLLHPDKPGQTLVRQLFQYIVSGGDSSDRLDIKIIPTALFLMYFAYNGARLALFWKLSKLVAEERIREAPAQESITEWRFYWLRHVVKFGSWIAIALFVLNAIVFGLTPVP
jgi:hypothetical protein